jgi:predicted CXXCH cytochrome family protein
MKHLLLAVIAVLLVSAISYGQALNQVLPTMPGGVQASRAAMLKGPHDFTSDSGAVNTFATDSLGNPSPHPVGSTKSLCSYCHAPHIPKDAIGVPLWARKSVVGRSFGYYQDVNTIPAGVITDPGTSDNYSSFCLGCHDGSAGIFAAAAYESVPFGLTGGTTTKVGYSANVVNGEFDLQHVHPVNFDYAAMATANPQEFYAPLSSSKVWSGDNGSGAITTVRLFSNSMQCSSCHNPHMNSGIGVVYSSNYGKLCVTCHKK